MLVIGTLLCLSGYRSFGSHSNLTIVRREYNSQICENPELDSCGGYLTLGSYDY